MPTLTFIDQDGKKYIVDATLGDSVMRAAVDNGVPGILADCGGGCSCATCHAYVTSGNFDPKSNIEAEMLDCVMEPRPNSRLTCQLIVTDTMGDAEILLPASQT